MAPRSTPSPLERRRRSKAQQHRRVAVLLTAVGVGLVAAGAALVVEERGQASTLDLASQRQRVLPAPGPNALALALAALRHRTLPVTTPASPRKHHVRQAVEEVPRPVRIVIPAIGVSAPIVALGLNSDHTVQVPANFAEAGWFQPGPEPGEPGSALVVGHVDSYRGPGVFFHLPALRPGDVIRVVLRTGRALRFIVTSTRQVSKNHFPTQLVFRKTLRPTLRLVTCGGRFDRSTRHYNDNYIVFAWLLGRP